MQDISEEMKQDQEHHRGSFMTLVAKRWRDLSDIDRAKYVEKASAQKEEYLNLKTKRAGEMNNKT